MSDDFESDKLKELRNKFRTVEGGKANEPEDVKTPPPADPEIPEYVYAILDEDGHEWLNTGFLIFTSHHVAIMRETPAGAMPVTLVPLNRVKGVELVPEDELELID